MGINVSLIGLYLLLSWTQNSDGACTFPVELDGVWISADKGALTFNSTTIVNYPVFMSYTVRSLDFVCEQQVGFKYLLKSTTTTIVFGNYLYGYVCIELRRVSAYKYYYYYGTNVEPTVNEHVYGRAAVVTVTMSDACNRATPYEDGTFVLLVKDGSPSTSMGESTCASALLANYGSVLIKDYASATSCSGTTVDGCSDRTKLQFNYASCTTGKKFSSGGIFTCLRALTYGDYTYLSLWNNDTTVNDVTTFRFTCMVVSSVGDMAYLTEYPRFCKDTTQSPSVVSSPGVIMELSSRTETCDTIADGAIYLMYIIIMASVGSFIILLFLIYVICCCKKGCPCSKNSTWCQKHPDMGRPPISSYMERNDSVCNTVFKMKSLPPLKIKHPHPFGPIVEANMIQPLPKVESLYGNNRAGRIMSSQTRRESLGSLFSFKFKN